MNHANATSFRYYTMPAIVLMSVCLVLFFNTFANEFLWDDVTVVAENRYVRDRKNIPLFFTFHYWNELQPLIGQYRPVREASLAVDYSFWGLNPAGYRITNLLLHAVNVVLIFYLVSIIAGRGVEAQREAGSGWRVFLGFPFLTALFFATHPIHTESINLIKNRSDLLAFLFFLISFLLFIKHFAVSGRMPRRLLIFGAWLSFIPAVLSKEMALTLPGVLILYAVCFLSRPDRKKTLMRIVPYGGMIIFCFWVMRSLIKPRNPLPPDVTLPADLGQHALAVIKTMGCYFKMLLLPFPLNLDHAFTVPESALELSALLPLIALLLIITGAIMAYQRARVVFFAVVWIFLTLIPASNIVYLGSRPIAEQRLYIPSLGFCLLLAYGIDRLSCLGSRRLHPSRALIASGLLAGFIVSLYAGITVRRNFDWRDGYTLYSRTLAVNPHSARIHYNIANVFCAARNYGEAVLHYQAALRLKPDYLQAYFNLGMTFYELERYGEAISHYRSVLRLEPDNFWALNNLGVAFYDSGRLEEAFASFQKALRVAPDDVEANWNMGDILVDMGRPEEAIGYYSTVLRFRPDCLNVYKSLGKVFMSLGEADKAIGIYSDALTFYPDDAGIHYEFGNALAEKGWFEEAIIHYATVLRLQPGHEPARRERDSCRETMGISADARDGDNAR